MKCAGRLGRFFLSCDGKKAEKEKGMGINMNNKWMGRITAAMMTAAILLVSLFTYFPESLGVEAADTSSSKAYVQTVMEDDEIMEVDIRMEAKAWEAMLENAMAEEYTSCDISVNGRVYYNVAIRPKGNTSLTQIASDDTTDRYSFKLDFDKYVNGQSCDGLDTLILNNIMSDSTYMKEYFSYDLMHFLSIPSSQTSFAHITLNGEEWGLYLALEGVEQSFCERNFGSSYGQLYKPESDSVGGDGGSMKHQDGGRPDQKSQGVDGGQEPVDEASGQNASAIPENNSAEDATGQAEPASSEITADQQMEVDTKNNRTASGAGMSAGEMPKQGFSNKGGPGGSTSSGSDLAYSDDEIDSYRDIFQNEIFSNVTEKERKEVIASLKSVSEGKNLSEVVDVDEVLRYMAANVFLVNLDSIFGTMLHNYYLYVEDGKISMIPWDYNLAFGGFLGNSATDAVNLAISDVVSGAELSDRPLFDQLLKKEEYKEKYEAYLKSIVDDYVNSGYFETKLRKMQNLISSYVKQDATAFYTYDEFETGVDTLLEFVKLRSESVKGQLNGTIPSTKEEQAKDPEVCINADTLALSAMGTQGGGKGGFVGEREEMAGGPPKQQIEETDAQVQEEAKPGMADGGNGAGPDGNGGWKDKGDKLPGGEGTSNTSGLLWEYGSLGASILFLLAGIFFAKHFGRRKVRKL